MVPKLWHAPESSGGLLKYRVLALPPEFLTQLVWEEVQEFASPSPTPHSQRLLLLLPRELPLLIPLYGQGTKDKDGEQVDSRSKEGSSDDMRMIPQQRETPQERSPRRGGRRGRRENVLRPWVIR